MDAIERLELATKLMDELLKEADKVLDAVDECHLKLVTSTVRSKESLVRLMNSVERSNDRWNRGKHKDV